MITLSIASLPFDVRQIEQFATSEQWSTIEVDSIEEADQGVQFIHEFLHDQFAQQKYPLTAVISSVERLIVIAEKDVNQLETLCRIATTAKDKKISIGYFLSPLVVNQMLITADASQEKEQMKTLLSFTYFALALDKARLADPKQRFILGVHKDGNKVVLKCVPEQVNKTAVEILSITKPDDVIFTLSQTELSYMAEVQQKNMLDVTKTVNTIKKYGTTAPVKDPLVERSALVLLHSGLSKLVV